MIQFNFNSRQGEEGGTSHNNIVMLVFQGIVTTGLVYVLLSWTIERKGPLYASVFSPLVLVIIAVVSWALLHENLYVGTYEIIILYICTLLARIWLN